MTIEFSLRRRATQSRCMAVLWLLFAVTVLIGCYVSMPWVAGKTLQAVNGLEQPNLVANGSFIHLHIFALMILSLCLFAASFASYLLARNALVETELAARFNGLADALCISGSDVTQLEKAVALFVPKSTVPSIAETADKNLKAVAEIVKNARR